MGGGVKKIKYTVMSELQESSREQRQGPLEMERPGSFWRKVAFEW